ncbi:hypothetical protein [Yinghuangia seranimata]|uniref:hypothetical protein n=1 Tax=Yinghuangia seranimata TaxID=408067 RepID=UPI00248BAAFE|nr:hypothetical protein [Yinghuangia seranimata]MDI2131025.1 hypothetical protein [Yinghuangia seranimata]
MKKHRLFAAVSVAALAIATLGACGDDGDGGADNTKTEAKALAEQAVAVMKTQEFIKLSAKGTDENGKPQTMSGCAGFKAKTLKATVDTGGGKMDVMMVGGAQYTKADGAGWLTLLGTDEDPATAEKVAKVAAGRYLKSTSEGDDDEIGSFFADGTDGYTKGQPAKFASTDVVPLTKEKDGAKQTYYIAAKGKPYIVGKLKEQTDSKDREETTFTRTEDKCEVTAPAADKTMTQQEFTAQLKAAGVK